MPRWIRALLAAGLLAGCSVSGGGTTTKDSSESIITVTSMTASTGSRTAGQGLISSDVSDVTTSDLADVSFQNSPKSASITTPSNFFAVTLTRYRVVFTRGDGGPVPAPFESAMSLLVPQPGVDSNGNITGGTASTTIAIVPPSLKGVAPLVDLPGGQSFTASATVTFEGADGLGRSLSATGGITVVFRRP